MCMQGADDFSEWIFKWYSYWVYIKYILYISHLVCYCLPLQQCCLLQVQIHPVGPREWVGPEGSLPGASIEGHVRKRDRGKEGKRERESPSKQSNKSQSKSSEEPELFMRRQQIKRAGGVSALPRWSSVILGSLLLYRDAQHGEKQTGLVFKPLCIPSVQTAAQDKDSKSQSN